MTAFTYTARDRDGNQTTGVIDARDADDVRSMLRNRELFLTALRERGRLTEPARRNPMPRRRVGLGDMVVMSRQLATVVGAGLPIVESLYAVAAQTENPLLARVLSDMRSDILAGDTLSAAMARRPRVFSEVYVALVEAGETGGVLEDTLETAAQQFDREAELRENVKAALVYPVIVAIAAAAVVTFMLLFVVPVFARVYDQFHAELPTVTRVLVAVSAGLTRYGWIAIVAGIPVGYLVRRRLRTPTGRLWCDRLRLRLPLVGRLVRKIAIARFTQTLSAVTRSGVPILRALSVSAGTSGNQVIVEAVMKVASFVKEGATIAAPLEQTGEFPPMVTRMIAAGEQSGELDRMLEQINRFYSRDIEYSVARLTRLLEPVMTLLVGGVVLFVLLALYMPIFNLSRVVRR